MEQPIDTAAHIRNLETMLRVTRPGCARDDEIRDRIEIELGELRSGRYHATVREFSGDEEWFREAKRRERLA